MVSQTYSELLDLIHDAVPGARIYVESVLPIATFKESKWKVDGVCKNSTIRFFNEKLKVLSQEKGMIYIDLYSAYEINGSLNPAYTVDGMHIYGHYEPWVDVLKKYIK